MATIRLAGKQDITRIVELYGQLSLDGSGVDKTNEDTPDRSEKAFDEIQAMPGCELIVAEENGTVIGTLMLNIVPCIAHGGRPWTIVENVIVDSEYRGTGVGKLMMEYVKEQAVAANCYKIQLMSDKRRSEAHKFYHAIGYNATAEGFRMYL